MSTESFAFEFCSAGADDGDYGANLRRRNVAEVGRQAQGRLGCGFVGHTRGLSFVLQRDDILADDAAVAPKLR